MKNLLHTHTHIFACSGEGTCTGKERKNIAGKERKNKAR